MTGNGGFLLAFSAAAGVHVAAIGLMPSPHGAESAGGDGVQEISVSIAGDAVAALVADWERVPDTHDAIAAVEAPKVTPAPEISAATDRSVRVASVAPLVPVDHADAPVAKARAPRMAAPMIEEAPWVPAETEAAQAQKRATLMTPADAALPRLDTTSPDVPDFAVKASLRPAPRATPAVATRAAGRGDSATRGTGTADAPRATASRQATAAAEAAWAAAIQRQIARAQVYPRGARGDGRVRLAMTVTSDGRLAGVKVLQSSGVAAFDTAAVRAAKRAAPFPAAPAVLTDDRFAFGQWVAFRR